MEPDKTLEGILELLDTKSTMRDFVEAFGVAIDHISEMKSENEQERESLQKLVSDSLEKAITRITTGSQQEWTKIRAQVAQLTDGKDGKDGHDGRDGRNGLDGRDGTDGKDGVDGMDGSTDSPEEIVAKINKSTSLISRERIEGLADVIRNMVANASVAVTTSFFNGLRAKNLTINGATAVQRGDTVFLTVSGPGGGQVNSVVAGSGISVDSTDPANPIVSTTGGGGSFLTPTGTVNGSNATFGVAQAPTMVISDGMGRVAGFGYTYSTPNIIMDIPPQDFIRYM